VGRDEITLSFDLTQFWIRGFCANPKLGKVVRSDGAFDPRLALWAKDMSPLRGFLVPATFIVELDLIAFEERY